MHRRCGQRVEDGFAGLVRRVAVLGVEPRRQLPREFVEGAVFNRRQRWLLRFARGAERQDVCGSVCRQLRCGFRQRVLDDFSDVFLDVFLDAFL